MRLPISLSLNLTKLPLSFHLNSTEVFNIAKQNLFDQNTKYYHYIGTEVQTAELYIKS